MESISTDKWLHDFFSSPNRIQWSSNEFKSSPDLDETIKEAKFWLQDRGKNESEKPILVPFCTKSDMSWYACCTSTQQRNQTIEELDSFVNITYSNVYKSYVLDVTNPCESALISNFQTNIIKITVHAKCIDKFLEALKLYRKLIGIRPSKEKLLIQSPGRIRYNFEQALLALNESAALNCMEDLKKSGNLDQQNQRFLEIRLNSALKKWDLLARDPMYLRSVIDIPLPAKIQQDLIESTYFSYLYKFELENDPIGAINTFRTEIRPYYSKIFKSRRGIKSTSVIKSFLLLELSKEKTNFSYCNALFSDYPTEEEGYEYAQTLLKLVSEEEHETSSLEQAEDAFEEENFDLALTLFLETEINKYSFKKILYCTFEIDSICGFNTVWDYCQKVPDDVIASLPPKSTKLYEEIKERFKIKKGHHIDGWLELFNFFLDEGDEDLSMNIVNQGGVEWVASETLLQSPQKIIEIKEKLEACFDQNSLFIKKIYPTFYESFFSSTEPKKEFKPIYMQLLEFIPFFGSYDLNDRYLGLDLARVLFEIGVVEDEYKEIMNVLSELFNKNKRTYQHLIWALDVSELLAIYSAEGENLALTFFTEVIDLVVTKKHRITIDEWNMIEYLAMDFNMSDYIKTLKPSELSEDEGVKINLKGKKIGIYTLTDKAGLRAKTILNNLYNGITVEINNDHVATKKLANLTKSSDVFAFAWKSSKHQAFYCIQKHIKNSSKLLMPPGKGSSSIVQSVNLYIQDNYL
jgi:hypothetical protein